MRLNWIVLPALLAAAALTTSCSTAGSRSAVDPAQAEVVRNVDPAAMAVIGKMSDYLESQPRLRFVLFDSVDRPGDSGIPVEFNHKRTVTLQRPDRLRIDVVGDVEQENFYYDGKTVNIELLKDSVYAKAETAGTIDAMLDDMATRYQVRRPASEIIRTGIAKRVEAAVHRAVNLGPSTIRGVECDHVALSGPVADWELWVEKGDRPVPRKLLIRYRASQGAERYTMQVESVETPASLDAKLFEFSPRADMEEIPFETPAAKKAGN